MSEQQTKEENPSTLREAVVELPSITVKELLENEGFENGNGATILVDKRALKLDDVITKGTKYIILPAIAGGIF